MASSAPAWAGQEGTQPLVCCVRASGGRRWLGRVEGPPSPGPVLPVRELLQRSGSGSGLRAPGSRVRLLRGRLGLERSGLGWPGRCRVRRSAFHLRGARPWNLATTLPSREWRGARPSTFEALALGQPCYNLDVAGQGAAVQDAGPSRAGLALGLPPGSRRSPLGHAGRV